MEIEVDLFRIPFNQTGGGGSLSEQAGSSAKTLSKARKAFVNPEIEVAGVAYRPE